VEGAHKVDRPQLDPLRERCELRTRIRALSLAKYRGAPRIRFGPRRTRDFSALVGSSVERRRFRSPSRHPRFTVEPSRPSRNGRRPSEHHGAGRLAGDEKPAAVPRGGRFRHFSSFA
jgi:hypothetical protein